MRVPISIWDFFQNEVLGMRWLNAVIGSGLSALGLDTTSRWGGGIQFFLYDVIKITLLLSQRWLRTVGVCRIRCSR